VNTTEVVSRPRPARDTHADAVRGVAIAALVLSHTLTIATQTPQVVGLNDFIISWNMPVFFFVAGWVMALQPQRGLVGTTGRRARSLLVPYLAWIGVLWVIGYPWSGGGGGVGTWFQILLAPKEMWFLYCLFLAGVLFAAIRAAGRRPVVVLTGVILLALAITAVSQRVQPGLLTLTNLGWLLPFLAVGYYGSRFSQRPPRLSTPVKIGIAVLALVLLSFTVGADLLRASMFRVWPLSLVAGSGIATQLLSHSARYALAAAGIATVWYVMRLAPAGAERAMGNLGTATLGIYALNSPLLTAMRIWFPAWSVTANPALTIVVVLLAALIVLGVEWVITTALGLNVITRRVLLGRWTRSRATSGV
jgi:fucose 4-O-acetylase-like acetyltransferase